MPVLRSGHAVSGDPTLIVSWHFSSNLPVPSFPVVPGAGSDSFAINFGAFILGAGQTATVTIRRELVDTASTSPDDVVVGTWAEARHREHPAHGRRSALRDSLNRPAMYTAARLEGLAGTATFKILFRLSEHAPTV